MPSSPALPAQTYWGWRDEDKLYSEEDSAVTYEEYLEICNSPVWENLTYGGQNIQPLTREEWNEVQNRPTQETQ